MPSSALPSSALPSSDLVSDIDRRLTAAWTEVTAARERFAHAPTGEVVTACESAEAALNELLDERFSLTHGGFPGLRVDVAARAG